MTPPRVAKQRDAEASDHRGVLRRLRLLSGLVMFAYITTHLVNHALGVISFALAESGLRLEMAFWRGTMPTIALYGAAAVHFLLALWTLHNRREWRLPAIEILRLASGFSFPLLLIGHAVTTRLGDTLFGIRPSYELVITNLLMAGRQGMQLALLAPGWMHGCLGIWIAAVSWDARYQALADLAGCPGSLPGGGRIFPDGVGDCRAGAAASGQPRCGIGARHARGVEVRSDDGLSRCDIGGVCARPAARHGASFKLSFRRFQLTFFVLTTATINHGLVR
jgi:hypothetical protein